MKWLRWLAPAVATAAVFLLPALQAAAPFGASASWSVAGLGSEVVQAARPQPGSGGQSSLRGLLQQVRSLRQEFGGGSEETNTALRRALALAALIPLAALLAGICALAALAATAGQRPRVVLGCAGVGLAASLYAIAASWWLTHAARLEVARALSRAQHSLGGLLGGLAAGPDWKSMSAGLSASLGVFPQAGLYVLGLAFLAVLILPAPSAGH
ncbi:MAG: hypothetical protein ACRD1E_06915 [Terriglobales bacterium]